MLDLFLSLGFSNRKARQLAKKYTTKESLLQAISNREELFDEHQLEIIYAYQGSGASHEGAPEADKGVQGGAVEGSLGSDEEEEDEESVEEVVHSEENSESSSNDSLNESSSESSNESSGESLETSNEGLQESVIEEGEQFSDQSLQTGISSSLQEELNTLIGTDSQFYCYNTLPIKILIKAMGNDYELDGNRKVLINRSDIESSHVMIDLFRKGILIKVIE